MSAEALAAEHLKRFVPQAFVAQDMLHVHTPGNMGAEVLAFRHSIIIVENLDLTDMQSMPRKISVWMGCRENNAQLVNSPSRIEQQRSCFS